MNFEVEIKFRAADHGDLRRRALAAGAEAAPGVDQEDVYLSHPSRDFARTDEALRLRRDGGSNRITYKGPKHGGPTKTREEIEIPYADGPEALAKMTRLFENLGFRRVAAVRKVRETFHLTYQGRPMEVVLDRVDGLGDFAEVEAIAADDADLPRAQDAVQALARELGLSEVETRSYLRMTLERNRSSP